MQITIENVSSWCSRWPIMFLMATSVPLLRKEIQYLK